MERRTRKQRRSPHRTPSEGLPLQFLRRQMFITPYVCMLIV